MRTLALLLFLTAQAAAQTPPWVGYRTPSHGPNLPDCDDVGSIGIHACILVSTEHWGYLPRPPVRFQCVKSSGVISDCWRQE